MGGAAKKHTNRKGIGSSLAVATGSCFQVFVSVFAHGTNAFSPLSSQERWDNHFFKKLLSQIHAPCSFLEHINIQKWCSGRFKAATLHIFYLGESLIEHNRSSFWGGVCVRLHSRKTFSAHLWKCPMTTAFGISGELSSSSQRASRVHALVQRHTEMCQPHRCLCKIQAINNCVFTQVPSEREEKSSKQLRFWQRLLGLDRPYSMSEQGTGDRVGWSNNAA